MKTSKAWQWGLNAFESGAKASTAPEQFEAMGLANDWLDGWKEGLKRHRVQLEFHAALEEFHSATNAELSAFHKAQRLDLEKRLFADL